VGAGSLKVVASGAGDEKVNHLEREIPTGQVSDIVYLLQYLFAGAQEPQCLSACDFDGDGAVRASTQDVLFAINFNFLGGPAFPPPFPGCGISEQAGDVALGCSRAQGCR